MTNKERILKMTDKELTNLICFGEMPNHEETPYDDPKYLGITFDETVNSVTSWLNDDYDYDKEH